jgi:hypothetical protein
MDKEERRHDEGERTNKGTRNEKCRDSLKQKYWKKKKTAVEERIKN